MDRLAESAFMKSHRLKTYTTTETYVKQPSEKLEAALKAKEARDIACADFVAGAMRSV